MNPPPAARRPLVLPGGNSIQPVEPGRGFAREAESIERLAADKELLNILKWSQYSGIYWLKFREALARYGVAVITKWIRSGQIFRECAKKGFGTVRRRRRSDADDAVGMAGETVAYAIEFFRNRVLIPGTWDPERGASVRTYFVGACILQFPNVYARSQGGERVEAKLVRDDGDGAALLNVPDDRTFIDPEALTQLARDFDDLPNDETRFMVLSRAEGYTDEEIGSKLNTTRKAIETRFFRLHRKAKR